TAVPMRLQAEPAQSLRGRSGARPARRKRDPLQTPPRGLHQVDQGRHIDGIPGPVRLLEHELRGQPVAGEVDQVPSFTLLEDRLEGLACDTVLEHAEIDGPTGGAGDRTDRL